MGRRPPDVTRSEAQGSRPRLPIRLVSRLGFRMVLRRLAAIEHAVIANDADLAMAQRPRRRPARRPALCRGLVDPGGEQQQLAGRINALEGLDRHDAGSAGYWRAEHRGEIGAWRRPAFRGRELADRHGFRRRDLGRIEALLGEALAGGDMGVRADLSHPEVVVLENLAPARLLDLVMEAGAAPADHRLLVAPGGEREQAPLVALAGEALVVDEAVDALEIGLEALRQAEINRPTRGLRLNFEDHGEHAAPPFVSDGGFKMAAGPPRGSSAPRGRARGARPRDA